MFAAAVVIVVAIGWAGYTASRHALEAERWVVHTHEVRATLEHLVSRVATFESAQRGYTLTADERFLDGHAAAISDARADVNALRSLTSDNARQRPRLDVLSDILEAKIAFCSDVVALVRAGKAAEARQTIALRHGDELMTKLRAVVGAMDAEEAALLVVRHDDARRSTRTSYAIASAAVGLALLVALLAGASAVGAARTREHDARRLERSERRFRLLAQAAFDGVVVFDQDGAIIDANDAMGALVDLPREQLLGSSLPALAYAADREHVIARLATDGQHEMRVVSATGSTRLLEVRVRGVEADRGAVRIATVRDITDRRERELAVQRELDRVRSLASGDALTGLLNRRGFFERAEAALASARSEGRACAILFADLNGMKPINDNLGHDAGDQALKDAATVLASIARRGDIVARLGGDEFAICVENASETALFSIASRIEDAVTRFNRECERSYVLSVSTGWSISAATDARSLERLVADADAAMYIVKRNRGNSRSNNRLAVVRAPIRE